MKQPKKSKEEINGLRRNNYIPCFLGKREIWTRSKGIVKKREIKELMLQRIFFLNGNT